MFNNTLSNQNVLTEKSKRMNLVNNPFNIKLKPHQEALLYKILDVDDKVSFSNVPYGVMSDKPGSGKTYVVLALIYFSIKYLHTTGANVIVVPQNIYSQWVSSIKKFLGDKLSFKLLLNYADINLLYTNVNILYEYDIILTTSLFYDTFASTIKSLNLNVRRVFFDEADTIQNVLMHHMPCGMTWFISASIKRVFNLKNNTATIGSYNLHLNQLLNNECHCDDNFIDKNIILPVPNIEFINCRDFYLDIILSKILDKEQLQFIDGHDFSNIKKICGNAVIKETIDIVENIYIYYMRFIDELLIQIKENDKKLKYANSTDDKKRCLETKSKLDNQKIFYELTVNQIKSLSITNYLCIFCFKKLKSKDNINKDTFRIDFYELECNTFLCNQCYNKELLLEQSIDKNIDVKKIKFKCLNCKVSHLAETLKFHTEEILFNDNYIDLDNMNKFKILSKILDIAGNKTIIYSQFKGVSNNMKTITTEYLQLDGGNIKDIDDILDKFKNDVSCKILIIDDTSFGVGLNIEYATDIIFFNYIEPKVKEQLIGRAQRLGRTKRLNIWNLRYSNEINL
jgi:hypothetical protein